MISLKAKLDAADLDINDLDEGSAKALADGVYKVAQLAQQEWIRMAQYRLRSSREDYVNGLRKPESFKTVKTGDTISFEVGLIGKMPNAFEFGMPAFDMKAVRPGWLGGSKAKVSKSGKRYVVIPFRHSLTSAARINYSGKAQEAGLRTELQRIVTKYNMNRTVRRGGRIAEGPVKRVPKIPMTGRIAKVFSAATTHPLSGLTRYQKKIAGGKASSTLMTFRIMSEDQAGKWLHPGIKPADILPDVEAFADKEMDDLIKRIF